MDAQLIDGVALSARLRGELQTRAEALTHRGVRPGLAVILVGDDPASAVYVRNKVKACQAHGLHSVLETYGADLSEAALLARIAALNADATIHGILVQMPLPPQINPQRVIESTGQPLRGRHAVVIGRSNTVGKPMALLLLQAHATVTICHSATPDLRHHTRDADIVVAAVGRRGTVTADMVKPGAIVIDVGINRNEHGKLCGDVDFDAVRHVAGWITPVPGGVGPMTITMLLANTVEAAERAHPAP